MRKKLDFNIIGTESPYEASCVPSGTSSQLVFFKQNGVGYSSFGQMVQSLTTQTSSAYKILL